MRNVFLWCSVLIIIYAPAQINLQSKLLTSGKIETWKTVEVGMIFPDQQRSYAMFSEDHARGMNPYLVQTIWMQFTCNGKKYIRPAFYMEEAIADDEKNTYEAVPSEWPWRVRFSPPDPGTYECVALLGENPDVAQPIATGIRFHVSKGERHGILGLRPNETRMRFTDGTPFFILGQDIAWSDQNILRGYKPFFPAYTSGHYDEFHFIHNLADNGGNYFRVVLVQWGFGVAIKDLNVFEQDRAFVIDSIIRIAEERGIYLHFVVDISKDFDAKTPKEEWHPIRRAYQKEGMTAADLLKDSAALAAFDNYMRYVHARWAYSANVSVIEVLSEHYLWEGFKEHPDYFYDYINHVKAFLKTEMRDSAHIVGTSLDPNELKYGRNDALAYIDLHPYHNDFHANRQRYFVYKKRIAKLNKPFMFGEMGITNGPVNACDPDDWDYCNDISMHNALWSTTFMGGMGAGLYWWQWKNDGYREANYKPLRWFIDSIADGMHVYTESGFYEGNGIETYYCASPGKRGAVGWAHNTSYWWGNMTDSCRDRNNLQMIRPGDDDKAAHPEDRTGHTFVIKDLKPRTKYTLNFYDTRDPKRIISTIVLKTNLLGNVRVKFPGGPDCAFKLREWFHAYL